MYFSYNGSIAQKLAFFFWDFLGNSKHNTPSIACFPLLIHAEFHSSVGSVEDLRTVGR